MSESATLTAGKPDAIPGVPAPEPARTLADHDLRRLGKGSTDLILQRADLLPEQDQALLRAVYEAGHPIAEVARLTGRKPRWLHKRVKQLVALVLSPEFVFVMRHRDEWPAARARVATRLFIYGDSIARVSRELRLTYYAARRHREAVFALMDAKPTSKPAPATTSAKPAPALAAGGVA